MRKRFTEPGPGENIVPWVRSPPGSAFRLTKSISPFPTAAILLFVLVCFQANSFARPSENSTAKGQAGIPSMFPKELPRHFALVTEELPPTYKLAHLDSALVKRMEMTENPGFVTNRSETAALASRGALGSFAAVYTNDERPLLILNGIYFQDVEDFKKFWEDQRGKELRLKGFQKKVPPGIWLILVGCDPDHTYSPEEAEKISQGLESYRKRLGLDPLFDTLKGETIANE